ncbi:MAG: TetR/AcrR family transcriptional regulator [Lentisphaeria bacterium]|nr:TetR/AcrR family transcriptional regulator [Lentisphaeria bacterium]
MTRGNYKVSEATRHRLIEAAGELFACRGVEAVQLREIAERAGTRPSAVNYHFGGKPGLIDAVWEYVLRRWDDRRLGRYCEENAALFATRDGQRQIVADVINLLYENLYTGDQPLWANLFLLRSVITAQELDRTRRVFGRQYFDVLCRIFRRITGNEDRMTGICWALCVISPGSYLTASATDFLSFAPTDKIDYAFCRRLQAMVTQSALCLAGLAADRK